ncbi:MAG: hypothetical protein ACJ8GW_11365 [Massilia sp.]
MSQYVFRSGSRVPLLLGLALLCALPAQASQLVPQNLKQMIAVSDLIVTGEVSKLSDGIANGVPYTEVTLKVKGSVKRELAANSTYSFRQYGLMKPRKLPDGRYLLPSKIEGMPTWSLGEHVTTFFNKPASHTGLRTPVGLAQGKLTAGGAKSANSFNNRGLFNGVQVDPSVLSADEAAMLASRGGAVQTGVLLGLVKRAVKEEWIARGVMR